MKDIKKQTARAANRGRRLLLLERYAYNHRVATWAASFKKWYACFHLYAFCIGSVVSGKIKMEDTHKKTGYAPNRGHRLLPLKHLCVHCVATWAASFEKMVRFLSLSRFCLDYIFSGSKSQLRCRRAHGLDQSLRSLQKATARPSASKRNAGIAICSDL